MCGITGKINFLNGPALNADEISKMNRAIKYRGPDDEGIFIDPSGRVGLGHCRLSIIDLSPAGHQPMRNEDKSCWIVFNGEIYNFKEIKKQLEKSGHIFRSQTDTEVILHLYEDRGENFLEHLRGMFALAIWDNKKQQIILARDRLGQKPLKYYLDSNTLIFASELKAILQNPAYHRSVDWKAVHHYFSLQYVPSPATGFLNIKKLPAGHYLKIKLLKNGSYQADTKQYWRLDFSVKENLNERQWLEKILAKLEEAVKIRMMADVPLGVMLSGGVDSSAVAALMARNASLPIKTFSIGFKEQKYNELPYARIVAKLLNTQHQEFIVNPELVPTLEKLVWHYEEPYADSSALPSFYVAQLAKQQVAVALNGDGGDENFAGYGRYNLFKQSIKWQWLASLARKSGGLKLLEPIGEQFNNDFLKKAVKFAGWLAQGTPEQSYARSIFYFTEEEKRLLYNEEFRQQTNFPSSVDFLLSKINPSMASERLDRIIALDIQTYLADDLLVKMDIATMANSLEGRSPFLDHELIELTAHIPPSLKIKNGINKYILKKSLEKILPKQILYRKKMGFGIPWEQWLQKEAKAYVEQILLSQQAASRIIFNQQAVHHLLKEQQAGRQNHCRKIWALLTFELWLQKFFGKNL